ncbi:lectin C-type domain protein, partial [Ancylostoma duodenale]
YFVENTNWADAEEECKKNDAHLASIHSKEENHFIADMVRGREGRPDQVDEPYRQGVTWIGLTRPAEDNNGWYWVDGTSKSYFNWAPNEPNNGLGNKECGELYSEWGIDLDTWNDNPCSLKHISWVCKKNTGCNR